MEKRVNHKLLLSMAALIVWLMMSLTTASAEAQTLSGTSDEGIVFLHLHLDNSGVTLIGHRLVGGRLKLEKIASKTVGLALQVAGSSGETYYTTVVENPLIKRYEYEDPDHPGQLKSKIVTLEEAEFWVRIPYRIEARTITFSLTADQPRSRAKGEKPFESVIDLSFLSEGGN